MKLRISLLCIIFIMIVPGIVFFVPPSSNAQTTSPLVDEYEMARVMRIYLLFIKGCEDTQIRLASAKIHDKLAQLYQVYLQKHDLTKKPQADYDRAQVECLQASKAYDEAHEKWRSMDDQCIHAVTVTKMDPKKIQSCIDAVSFSEKVLAPRYQTEEAKCQVKEDKEKILTTFITAAQSAHSAYIQEAWVNLDIDYYYLKMEEYNNIKDADPDQLKRVVKDICSRYQSDFTKVIQKAKSVVESMVKACNISDAESFLRELPDYPGKDALMRYVSDARQREDIAGGNYEEGRELYRKGRLEEIRGQVSQAQDLYRKAIAKMQEGRKLTVCDSRVKQFDKAIEQISSRVDQKAAAGAANCEVPKDCEAQKRALHARIRKGNTFRKDGGGQWHPDIVMRAGYSVGSEKLRATALELAAMTNLIGGYEQCYARYWSFMEGELPQMVKARDDAFKRGNTIDGQRYNVLIGRRKDEVTRTHNQCIADHDATFRGAIQRARDQCKP